MSTGEPLPTTSTPPAWHFLHECDAPVTMAELSVHSHNLPVADALREQNDSDQCPECRCAPGQPHALGCDGTAQVTDSVSNAVATHVESCPECGTVTDIEYEDAGPDTFHVPFPVQEWMFEELAEAQLEYLHDILNKQSGRIIEMARDRFRDGYKLYDSKMFAYTPDERLLEVLCELADADCYLVSGPVG